jgi:hypothetical protein
VKIFNPTQKLLALILLSLILFSGCATWQSGDESETKDFIEFANVPIPSSFTLDSSRSFIYESGSGSVKVGRLFYSGMNSQDETVAYFKTGMLNRGWKPVNTMTYDAGVILNYKREGWSSSLNITSGWFKTYVEIKIGPN